MLKGGIKSRRCPTALTIPLLYLYLLFGFTGYIPFVIGGAACVLSAFNAMAHSPVQPEMSVINGISGAICGLLFG